MLKVKENIKINSNPVIYCVLFKLIDVVAAVSRYYGPVFSDYYKDWDVSDGVHGFEIHDPRIVEWN